MPVDHLYVFFCEMSIEFPCPLFNQVICFLAIGLLELPVDFEYEPLLV